jgi:uncharacterized protein (TIGR02145 family)
LKFDSAETIYIVGEAVLEDTIEVRTGWNIIGSLTVGIDVNAINTDPSSIIVSDFFGYVNGTYQSTDTLRSGFGYWVKVSQNGALILSPNLTPAPPQKPPILSSPLDGSANISVPPTLIWKRSIGATSYTLQVSTDSLFSRYVYDQSGLSGTSQQITELTNSRKYYWHVSATNNYGTSGWSNMWAFTTKSLICGDSLIYANKKYHTIAIGTQCWLKENLDVGTMIQGTDTAKNNGIIEKYCYNNDPNNCNTYGGLYQWDEAMQYSTNEGARGICPEGWHIPTEDEFQTLSTTVGNDGNSLKSIGQGTGAGAGTNNSGFSALLSGIRNYGGPFSDLGYFAYFWGSAVGISNVAHMDLWGSDGSVGYGSNPFVEFGFSVRCVKD